MPLGCTHVTLFRPQTSLLPAGEILFVVIGVILQVASICTESVRLTLVQILLQKRGIKVGVTGGTFLWLGRGWCRWGWVPQGFSVWGGGGGGTHTGGVRIKYI